MKKLFLFDIDGTLIRSGGAGKRSFDKAFQELFGIRDAFKNVDMHGMLDPIIFNNAAQYHKIKSNGHFVKFKKLYIKHLKEESKRIETWRKIEGIIDFLKKYKNQAYFALLTGNIFEGAKIKLQTMKLWEYFDTPEVGAYGDHAKERVLLGEIALDNIKKIKGLSFNSDNIYVFGDTKHDIAVAKHIKAKSVALTSGGISEGELKRHNPDYIADNYNDLMKKKFEI